MKVITPLEITESTLTSSTIPEPDTANGEVEWVAGTYLLGDQVVVSTEHSKYQCVADPSTTDDPVAGAAKTVPTWVRISATNRYAMFDANNGTQSIADQTITVRVNASQYIDSIALFNVTGSYQVQIIMNDPLEGEVYNEIIETVDNTQVIDAWTYYFSPIIFIDKFVKLDLPPYANAYIEVIVTGGDTVGLGSLVIGNLKDLYQTVYGTKVNLLNRSIIEDDGFGNYNITERPSSYRVTYEIRYPTIETNAVLSRLEPLIDKLAVWIGEEEEEYRYTLHYGFYKDSDIFPSSPSISELNIEIEGIA